jgi:hypothetical protein
MKIDGVQKCTAWTVCKSARRALLVLLLAGCATDRAAEDAARAEAYRQHVRAQCHDYGFEPNTKEFRECLMRVDMQYRDQQQRLLQQMLLGQ